MSSEDRQTLLQAWIDARNEVDRSIFLSASAGVGFCATLLFGDTAASNTWMCVFLAAGLVLFAVSAASTLRVFRANADFMSRLISDPSASNRDSVIERWEKLAMASFVLAIVAIGGSVVSHLVKDEPMTSKQPMIDQHQEKGLSGIPVQPQPQQGGQSSTGTQQSTGTGSGSSTDQSGGSSPTDSTK